MGAGTHALNGGQQAEPFTLGLLEEPVEMNVILADVRFYDERHRLAAARQLREGPGGTEHQITDAVYIDHGPVLADRIEQTGQLGDHAPAPAARAASATAGARR